MNKLGCEYEIFHLSKALSHTASQSKGKWTYFGILLPGFLNKSIRNVKHYVESINVSLFILENDPEIDRQQEISQD